MGSHQSKAAVFFKSSLAPSIMCDTRIIFYDDPDCLLPSRQQLERWQKEFDSNPYLYKYFQAEESFIAQFSEFIRESERLPEGTILNADKAFAFERVKAFVMGFLPWILDPKNEKKFRKIALKPPLTPSSLLVYCLNPAF
ncbi:hypothetical protein D9613_001479 [Agrocybe pediades]|uniref:Uncharacterized protein n=1 Tax=Agrocybe pediades TaxID=84607 RepID=A0A8H4R5S9_9AGAR|nr:hypothetical protein D9613_001479 [Agrocybe pediades]